MPWVILEAIICNILIIKENNALGKRSDNHESQNSVLNRRTSVVVSFLSSIYLHYGMFLLVDHSKRERLPYPEIAQISQPAKLQLTTRSKNNEKGDAASMWIFNLSTLPIKLPQSHSWFSYETCSMIRIFSANKNCILVLLITKAKRKQELFSMHIHL